MRLLVTGAYGFIAKNLIVRLTEKKEYSILKFGRKDPENDLSKLVNQADVVIHLAAENRPKDISSFQKVNTDLTKNICNLIRANKREIPLIDQHDQHGFWGGKFGGSFIPETLKKPVEDLTNEFKKLRKDKKFLKKRDFYFKNYIGTPTSFVKLDNLTNHLGGAQIWAKVVSEANGGAHKIYNATVHALICKAMGKKYIVGDTGAGYAGKMLSMAAKKFGLKCKIFMGAKDIKRQKPNCDAMKKNGAEIVPVYSGSQTLVDAVSECMRYWVSNCDNTHMCVGSTVGPNIFVKICGWSTAQISRELKVQLKSQFKKIPNKIKLINCVGGGSSAYGFWSEFIDYNKNQIELIGVEAGGPQKSKLHAAPLSKNSKVGILHGAAAYCVQNSDGQINETESISSGLDYPSVSPIHCFLKDSGRAKYTSASDEEALDAYRLVNNVSNVNILLSPDHAALSTSQYDEIDAANGTGTIGNYSINDSATNLFTTTGLENTLFAINATNITVSTAATLSNIETLRGARTNLDSVTFDINDSVGNFFVGTTTNLVTSPLVTQIAQKATNVTISGDVISANDMSKVIMLSQYSKKEKKTLYFVSRNQTMFLNLFPLQN